MPPVTNLLDYFSLYQVQLIKIHSEIKKPVSNDKQQQIKIEIKLSPSLTAHSNNDLPEYQMGCKIHCEGYEQEGDNQNPVFIVEVVMNTLYRQVEGDVIDFETFSKQHGSLNRQLYPLMHQQVMQQLSSLNLGMVRLPYDLFSASSVKVESTSKETGETERVVH